MNAGRESLRAFPDRWLREHRGGYGYVERVPCRIVSETPRGLKIEALRRDGSTAIRCVAREKVERG